MRFGMASPSLNVGAAGLVLIHFDPPTGAGKN